MQTRVLATVCLAFFLATLDTTIVNIAVPDLQQRLGASLDQALWVVNSYTLTFAVLLLTCGRLGDRYGHRTVFLAGLVCFTVTSALCGAAQSPAQLIAMRALQGAGAAMLMPQTLAIITTVIPPARRGVAFGVWSGVAGLATVAGPTVGGLLVDTLTWRSVFLVNLPIGALAIGAASAVVPSAVVSRSDRPASQRSRLDLTGVLLSSAGLFLLVFTLLEGERYDWQPAVLATGGVGAALLAGFWLQQRSTQAQAPLLPFQLFRTRNFVLMNTVLMAALFATVGLLLSYTLYLQSVLRLSPALAGLVLAPPALVTLVVSPVAGRLADRLDPRLIFLPGLSVFAAGFVLLMAASDGESSALALLPGMVVCGAGAGVVFAPANTLAMREVPPALAGAASGVVSTLRQVATVLGATVVGAILQAGIAAGQLAGRSDRAAFLDALPAALWTVVGVLVVTAAVSWRTRQT